MELITKTLNFTLPSIYPITDTRLAGLTHAEQVEQFAAGGATFIQLREKHSSPRIFYEEAKKALDVARALNVTVIINDRADIALALKAPGAHLGQDDLPPEEARRLLGDDAIIGYSTHSVGQAIAAARLPLDYIAVGPVFPTSTKEDPDAVIGLEGLKAVREALGERALVAIGGINSGNLASVLQAGADSAAIISGLFAPPLSISENVAKLLSRI